MSQRDERTRSSWIAVITTTAALVLMSWLSWRKWPDLLIDFGQQLYIPWRIASGAVLYRDIAHLPGGPLSQHFNAWLFKLFGPSLNVLVAVNYALLAVLLGLVYRLFRRAADQLTAVMATLSIVLGFAFSQHLDVGNYNYIAPYSHEITHGLLLSVVMLYLLAGHLENRSRMRLCAAGLCFGAVFLTKPEMFLAAAAAASMPAVLLFTGYGNQRARSSSESNREERPMANDAAKTHLRQRITPLLWFSAFSLVVPGIFLLWFLRTENVSDSFRYVSWAWVPLLTSKVGASEFYQSKLGMDDPLPHLWMLLAWSAGLAGFLAVCARCLRANSKPVERIVLFTIAAAIPLLTNWMECGYALPLLTATGIGMLAWGRKKRVVSDAQFVAAMLWLLFGLFLLAKMGLHPRISHYGFVLAMPAFVGGVYLLLWLLPRIFERLGTEKRLFRAAMLVLLCTGLFRFAAQSHLFYREKNSPIGAPADRIIAPNPNLEPSTAIVDSAVQWLATNTTPSQTVAVLPEGTMLNYLARRVNPTPYLVFMAEVSAFGEERMAAAYRANPPDFILLMHRDSSEYGLPYFGQQKGYGLDLMQWIERDYQAVLLIGHEPLRGQEFGIRIFKRRF